MPSSKSSCQWTATLPRSQSRCQTRSSLSYSTALWSPSTSAMLSCSASTPSRISSTSLRLPSQRWLSPHPAPAPAPQGDGQICHAKKVLSTLVTAMLHEDSNATAKGTKHSCGAESSGLAHLCWCSWCGLWLQQFLENRGMGSGLSFNSRIVVILSCHILN